MADKFGMTAHKLFWHLDRVCDWTKEKRIAPLHIDLGVTTGCDIACKYCYGMVMERTNASKRYDMPFEAMKNLFMDCKDTGVKSIALTGEGENLLNPGVYDALLYAKEIGLDIGLATNGLSVDKKRMKDLLSSLIYIRFNISGATRQSYHTVHGKDVFDKVINFGSKAARKHSIRKNYRQKKTCLLAPQNMR